MAAKRITDIIAMLMTVCAIVTGFMLHREIHHLFVYDDTALWATHIAAGLILTVAVALHCVQHKFWFKNYAKIAVTRKTLTTMLFALAIVVAISGIILALGSHSHFISILHYITAIAFTLLAITHVIQRRKPLQALFK